MNAPQNFRSAFNGFNREDVVHYLEYLNARHAAQLNQLNSEADYLRNKLEALQPNLAIIQERDELLARVAELEAYCAQLEQQVAAVPAAPVAAVVEEAPAPAPAPVPVPAPAPAPSVTASEELEAYRRAERVERAARERAELVYHQVNGVLAEASGKVDNAANQIGTLADQVMAQLIQLQAAVTGSKDLLQDAASTVNAIKNQN